MTDALTQLLAAKAALQADLQKILDGLPQARALERVNAAIEALRTAVEAEVASADQPPFVQPRARLRIRKSYAHHAVDLLNATGRPVSTGDVVEYINGLRPDQEVDRDNVASSLSRSEMLQNINWQGGKSWWFARMAAPRHLEKSSAGQREAEPADVLK